MMDFPHNFLFLFPDGYLEVVAIATEPGVLYRNIFQSEPVPSTWNSVPIHIIRPDIDAATLGADYTDVTDEGLVAGYEYEMEKGKEFLTSWMG